MKESLLKRDGTKKLLASLLSILIGLTVGALVVAIVGLTKKNIGPAGMWDGVRLIFIGLFANGRDAAGQLAWGFNPTAWGNMLFRATPVIMTGLSVAVAFKTGLFNIGAPGQYLMGTMATLMIALGIPAGTPIGYRAGDQPNNALSLGVFNPGEIASTAGTSGVVYGVLDSVNYDPKSRVNTFAHVNHTPEQTRLGVLLCINGTGILNSWLRRNALPDGISYAAMNDMAATAPIGADSLSILPFGNGAERVLENRAPGCSIHGLNFNIHTRAHLVRAAQEGIVYSFKYGIEVMEQMGMQVSKIHAGHANMFLSPLFRQTLANVTGATIELYDTDGSVGAARGAGIGAGIYKDSREAFASLQKIAVIEPNAAEVAATAEAYERWKSFV